MVVRSWATFIIGPFMRPRAGAQAVGFFVPAQNAIFPEQSEMWVQAPSSVIYRLDRPIAVWGRELQGGARMRFSGAASDGCARDRLFRRPLGTEVGFVTSLCVIGGGEGSSPHQSTGFGRAACGAKNPRSLRRAGVHHETGSTLSEPSTSGGCQNGCRQAA